MIFPDADKAIMKHYHEKEHTVHKIWKDSPEKHWGKTLVKGLIKRFEVFGTMERQKGSRRPRTATTPGKEEALEEIICSQEGHFETHVLPKDIAEEWKISQSSIRRMIEIKRIKQFKRLKTLYMNDVTQETEE